MIHAVNGVPARTSRGWMAPPAATIRSTISMKSPCTISCSPVVSEHVMNGPTSPRVAMPPRQLPCSTTSTSAPLRAAAIAAHAPAGPPPTTTTE